MPEVLKDSLSDINKLDKRKTLPKRFPTKQVKNGLIPSFRDSCLRFLVNLVVLLRSNDDVITVF